MLTRKILVSTLTALCLLATLSCCSSDDSNNDPNSKINPKYSASIADEPSWVSGLVTNEPMSVYVTIDKGTYKDETVYIWGSCCPQCNTMTVYFDEHGNQLQIASPNNTITNITPVYRGTECVQI